MNSTNRGTARARALLMLAALCGLAACGRDTPAPSADQAAAPQAPAESLKVAGASPKVAPVFLLARRPGGVRVALDSLQALIDRDASVGAGHELAHALGRFAMAERKDLSVLGECTPVFQSGCFHGALEGYFLQGKQVDQASIRTICPTQVAPDQPGYELLECWHGLGHGMMVHFAGDFARAVPMCDALQTPLGRRECADGVFMERAIRAVGLGAVNVGSGPAMGEAPGGHGHGAHGGHAAVPQTGPLTPADLLRLCSGVDARHQPSCWAYQPIALLSVHNGEPVPVLRACDGAPANAVGDCYRGFGKQFLGVHENTREMIRACRQGSAARVGDCLLGGVEYYTDLEWTIEPGIRFCRGLPGRLAEAKAQCYDLIGQRLALIHPDPRQAEAACRRVERGFVQACLAGASRAPVMDRPQT